LTIAAACDYDPYGRSLGAVPPAVPGFAFQGKYADPETGLVYFGFRWYDPATAKWLSSDPIQEAGGLNLYAFCQGDPVNGVEYLGCDPESELTTLLDALSELPESRGEIDQKIRGLLREHPELTELYKFYTPESVTRERRKRMMVPQFGVIGPQFLPSQPLQSDTRPTPLTQSQAGCMAADIIGYSPEFFGMLVDVIHGWKHLRAGDTSGGLIRMGAAAPIILFDVMKMERKAAALADAAGPRVLAPERGINRQSIIRGFQEHHIISNKNALTAEHELLDLAGFNLESRANKLFLPPDEAFHSTRSLHLGRHTTGVSRSLAEQMDAIVEVGRIQGWTQQQYRDALLSLISQERQSLKTGVKALNINARPWAE
jgi:RHS repeat-associated protein